MLHMLSKRNNYDNASAQIRAIGCRVLRLKKKKNHESLPFIANVIVPQAVRSREGGAAQHGWRRLSDVTGDDGQSQSGAGRRPGAGGRELIGGPGVTRIPVFSSHGIPPSRRTVSSHTDPPARLEKKKKKREQPLHSPSDRQPTLSPRASHHWDYLSSMHLEGDRSKRNS